LHAVEREVKRALLDFQRLAREDVDALGDAPAVLRAAAEHAEDHHLEVALQKVDSGHERFPYLS
jgi:hypothetical protein